MKTIGRQRRVRPPGSVNGIFGIGKIIFLALAAWLTSGGTVGGGQDSATPGEYQVKAAILYNLAKFVEWQEDAFPGPAAPLVIGILGDDPFGSAFDSAKDKLIKGRKVQLLRSGKTQDLSHCHVLFISSSERGRLSSVLKEFQGPGALLVSDMDKFAIRGGMIGLVMRADMVDFEINVDAVQRAGLRISDRLLNTARIIRDHRNDSGKMKEDHE